jgi:hypothetical protein
MSNQDCEHDQAMDFHRRPRWRGGSGIDFELFQPNDGGDERSAP